MTRFTLSVSFAVTLALVGCDGSTDSSSDAGGIADLGSTDQGGGDVVPVAEDTGGDVAESSDAASDSGASTDATDPTDAHPDAADCVDCQVVATNGAVTLQFERAVFGFTSAAQSDNGVREVHTESYIGGADGCPEMDSPAPDQTLIVTGFPAEPGAYDRADGLAVTILDFEGVLIEDGVTATALTAEITVSEVTDDGVTLDVSAQLDGGIEVTGELVATRCVSLDVE